MDGNVRLANDRAQVEVDLTRGGRISSLVVDGWSLLVGPSDDDLAWGAYVMAPWAGRVRDGRFSFDGLEHQLPRRTGEHALHGTVLDRQWEQLDVGRLRTPLGASWPWSGSIEHQLDLDEDGLTLELTLSSDSEAFPASMGWHPWFLRRITKGGAHADLDLDVQPVDAWDVDAELIPTGVIGPAPGPPWDTPFDSLARAPVLRWPGALDLSILSDVACWVIYSEPEHAVCVEPQTARPDALSLVDVAVVRPGAPLTASCRLAWSAPAGG
ncbi:MAG: aldose 1-epimerase [Glaciecola sp.]|jgi:aldose 1-epimerase